MSLQLKPLRQSAFVAHVVRHAVLLASHAKPPHDAVATAGQLPAPSQVAGSVAVPFSHEALRHDVSGPTRAAHFAGSVPSQICLLQGASSVPSQAARAPCGAPLIGRHVPRLPGTSHASH